MILTIIFHVIATIALLILAFIDPGIQKKIIPGF
jgi:hypothetical protein